MLVKCGTVDITERVLSLTKKGTFADKKIIGQVPSFQLSLQLNNKDGYFDDKLDELFYYTELGSSSEKVFVVYEKPEKYTKQLSLILYDRSYELDIRYDTKLDYTNLEITINDQLDEMESLTGFIFERDSIPDFVKTQSVNWYDNTLTIRSYLCLISELFGANVFSNGINSFAFIPISKEIKHTTSLASDYEKGELHTITRICFDNSVIKAEEGTTEGNTLYLSTNNLYIDDTNKDEIVQYIYSVIGGLSVNALSKFKTKNIIDLQLGEIINYNDEFNVIVLGMTSNVISATAVLQDLTGELSTKNEEKQINKISLDTRVRMLKVEFNEEKQKWAIIAETTEDNKSQIAQLTLDSEEIKSQVSNVESDLAEQTASLSVKMDSIQTNILTSGRNNLIVNSIGIFEDGWDGDVLVDTSTFVKNKNIYGYALSMPAESRKQIIQVPAGTYTLSFLYKKNVELANCSLMVNGTEFILSNTELTEIVHTFEANAGSITIELNSDTDGSCTLINLMLNQGSQKMVWSLNKAESWTENVKMSASGLEITNAAADVLFSAKADIIGFKNRNTGEYVSVFTDTGMEVDEIVVRKKANIGGLLIQRINDQVIMNNVGGVD